METEWMWSIYFTYKRQTWKLGVFLMNKNTYLENKKIIHGNVIFHVRIGKWNFHGCFLYGKLNWSILSNNFPYNNHTWKLSRCGFSILHTKYACGNLIFFPVVSTDFTWLSVIHIPEALRQWCKLLCSIL